MGTRFELSDDVFNLAIDRMVEIYREGHRVVVSFSGGKDSTVCMEICKIAAESCGRGPVEVLMRDEEIMYPGVFEYCDRVAARPDVQFHWLIAGQPVVNVYNRNLPYYWVFDDRLQPEQWMRLPPDHAVWIEDLNIERMTIPERFPPDPGKDLYAVIGLRVYESRARLLGIYSSQGYCTVRKPTGTINCRPIYDWRDDDVWKAIFDNGWDYADTYNTYFQMGIKKSRMRVAPPLLNWHGAELLQLASKAWPKWFDKLCQRVEGARAGAMFGRRAASPLRRVTETWRECFQRECIDQAPAWIAKRAQKVHDRVISSHALHSSEPFPDFGACIHCGVGANSWRILAQNMWAGDPFSLKFGFLPYVEPSEFRPDFTRTWKGKPSF